MTDTQRGYPFSRQVSAVIDRLPPRVAQVARKSVVGQVVRFGIVGVANTLVYYLLYRLFLAATLPYVLAHLIAWALSVVFSYFANCWFTYRVRPSWRSFIAFPATTLVNVAFTTIGSVLLVSLFSADTRYITLAMGILAIPFTFLVTRMVLVGRDPESPSRDWATFGRGLAAPVTAGVGAVLTNLLIAQALGLAPFGEVGRGVGDYGPQYLPFHLYLHDVLHGNAMGDAAFTWHGAAGTGFLPEYATYLGGPFTLLVALLPLRWMDLSILLVSLLRIGGAAGAMMGLLQMLRPHAPKVAGVLLAIGYGTSSWVVQLGMTTPQWLDGLLAFPLICIAAVLTVRHRAVVAPVALVALGWWSNYYSAMMASIGAGVFLVAFLIATGAPVLRGLLAFVLRGALGVGTALWLLWPSLLAVRGAAAAPASLNRVGSADISLRLFGFTAGLDFPPMLFAGSLVLVAAAAVLLAPRLGWRARITWAALGVVAVASLQWKPAIQLFNGGDTPNGNAYRWSFVVIGLMVIAGWHAFTEHRPDADVNDPTHTPRGWLTPTQLLLALVVVSLLVWHASSTASDLTRVTHSLWWLGPYAAIAALFGYGLLPRSRVGWRAAGQVVLVFGVVVELVWSGMIVTPHSRHQYGVSEPYLAVSGTERQQSKAVLDAADWPNYRAGNPLSSPQPRWNIANDPLRLGLPGVSMYTSTLPAGVERSLGQFGLWAGSRHIYDQPGLLTDVLLSLRSRWDNDAMAVAVTPVMPMVRTLTSPPASPDDPIATDPIATWASMFNTSVISAPSVDVAWDDAQHPDLSTAGVVASRPGHKLVYRVTCQVGSPSFRTPNLAGKAVWVDGADGQRVVAAQGQFIDDLAATAQTIAISHASREAPYTPVGLALCIDHQALAAELESTDPPRTTVEGRRLTAQFAEPQTGQVLIATTFQQAWSCRADGRNVQAQSRGGLLALPVDGVTEVSCVHRTPGIGVGMAGSLVAMLATIVLTVLVGRSTRATPPAVR